MPNNGCENRPHGAQTVEVYVILKYTGMLRVYRYYECSQKQYERDYPADLNVGELSAMSVTRGCF